MIRFQLLAGLSTQAYVWQLTRVVSSPPSPLVSEHEQGRQVMVAAMGRSVIYPRMRDISSYASLDLSTP